VTALELAAVDVLRTGGAGLMTFGAAASGDLTVAVDLIAWADLAAGAAHCLFLRAGAAGFRAKGRCYRGGFFWYSLMMILRGAAVRSGIDSFPVKQGVDADIENVRKLGQYLNIRTALIRFPLAHSLVGYADQLRQCFLGEPFFFSVLRNLRSNAHQDPSCMGVILDTIVAILPENSNIALVDFPAFCFQPQVGRVSAAGWMVNLQYMRDFAPPSASPPFRIPHGYKKADAQMGICFFII
jgi:hypothetical protein